MNDLLHALAAESAKLATTEAALTQALAERDGLREALEHLTVEDCEAIVGWESWHPELPDDIEANGCGSCHVCVARAALATAPNTKDGEG